MIDDTTLTTHRMKYSAAYSKGREHIGKEELLFVSFCIEMYARRHGMDGGDVFRLFDEKGVCDFLVDCYDPLHSQGREYILDEIELFMKGASNNANA